MEGVITKQKSSSGTIKPETRVRFSIWKCWVLTAQGGVQIGFVIQCHVGLQ